ncbi:thioesterase family protein [Gordonia desulfuricans]|uniref:Thioesterase family protein n=1 Tax=Gordonia desulfuricans TaxID=89051 RepID=A0A7K3LL06_9ACTN|nr:acyl-CoA thioesterase domain-containing protein [Gordonia desulfuricans]NDK88945.1 thioesterase family protein [Gordonia desulfuricans]
MTELAFFRPESDGRVMPTHFSRSLWAPGTLNGPAVCAIAAHHTEDEFAETGFRPARFTVDMFKAARDLPTSMRSRLVRSGGRIRVAEVDVFQHPADGEEVLAARATTVYLRESQNPPGQRWTRPDSAVSFVPPAETTDDLMPFFATDPADAPFGGVPAGEWTREIGSHQTATRKRLWAAAAPAVAGEPLTPFVQAAISAESTSLVCNWGSTGIGFINCDLTMALSRLPRGTRIGIEADSHTEHDGISVSTAGLYDADGMFGTGMVTAVNNAAAQIDFTTVDSGARYREA